METHSEVDRLKKVYLEYAERGWRKTKWAVENKGNLAIRKERERKLEQFLQCAGFLPLDHRRILDVGCGTGENLAAFETWGARPENLFGVDLLSDRIRRAKENFPKLTFQETNAEALPFGNGCFDLAVAFTVFTSIRDPRMARNVSGEIGRLLRSGGAVVWYDFRMKSPFNPHVRGLSRQHVQDLFPEFDPHLLTITLVPPLARRLGCLTDLFYPWLASLPFLRSHYLGLLIKS